MIEVDQGYLDSDWVELVKTASQVKNNAYCPYSRYQVGAALLCVNGEIVASANVENAAYGSTICAERSALVAANSRGLRDFKRLVVSVVGEIAAPCGACRQVLHEFSSVSGLELEILLHGEANDTYQLTTISELLPHGFDFR